VDKRIFPDGKSLRLERGDITLVEADVIVNAANARLAGGGGVDGAIHRAAGPELLAECRTLGGCQSGEAKITRGYNLPARFVIHTVGPFWTGGHCGEAEVLANCYRNSLHLALENSVKTIAFPAISCGAYRYPIIEAAEIAVETTQEFLANNDKIDKVIFVVANDEIHAAYQRSLVDFSRLKSAADPRSGSRGFLFHARPLRFSALLFRVWFN
jgi:O-acetyl-ADP-ribose deacetylase (regulator of RNase III)